MAFQPKKIDPRVVRTQRLLRKAMFELLETREFEQITVQDIADLATIKRATFYLHFNDKQDLVQQCITELLQELRESMEYSSDEFAQFNFTSGEAHPSFIRLFHHVGKHYGQYQALLVKNRIPAFSSGLMDLIHEFVSQGINHIEPNDSNLTAHRDVIIKYVESAFLEVIIWWIENQMPYPEKDMASQLMNLSIKGPYIIQPGHKVQ